MDYLPENKGVSGTEKMDSHEQDFFKNKFCREENITTPGKAGQRDVES
jgi:hypothetical protein